MVQGLGFMVWVLGFGFRFMFSGVEKKDCNFSESLGFADAIGFRFYVVEGLRSKVQGVSGTLPVQQVAAGGRHVLDEVYMGESGHADRVYGVGVRVQIPNLKNHRYP